MHVQQCPAVRRITLNSLRATVYVKSVKLHYATSSHGRLGGLTLPKRQYVCTLKLLKNHWGFQEGCRFCLGSTLPSPLVSTNTCPQLPPSPFAFCALRLLMFQISSALLLMSPYKPNSGISPRNVTVRWKNILTPGHVL